RGAGFQPAKFPGRLEACPTTDYKGKRICSFCLFCFGARSAMRSILLCGALMIVLAGCRLPPDREPFKPLAEDGARYSYAELLSRLHSQANAAMDAFFVDAW